MRYPVVIHNELNSAYGVTVPGIPGCFSAGETMDEALDNTIDAIESHLALLAEEGELAPIANHIHNEDYAGATWGFVDIDISAYTSKTE